MKILQLKIFFIYHRLLQKKTDLANKTVIDAINAANNYGTASMCMLGNSIFAMGDTDKLCNILSAYGKVYICTVDEGGARIIE